MRAQGSKLDCNLSSSSLMLTGSELTDSELDVLDLLNEVETLTLTLGRSFSVVVVGGGWGLKGPKGTLTKGLVVLAKAGLDVGRKGVVVTVGSGVVVVVDVVDTGVGRVGMKGTGDLMESSMESLSTNPCKVCLLLSFCKLITVISSACWEVSVGTAESRIKLLSSESSKAF